MINGIPEKLIGYLVLQYLPECECRFGTASGKYMSYSYIFNEPILTDNFYLITGTHLVFTEREIEVHYDLEGIGMVQLKDDPIMGDILDQIFATPRVELIEKQVEMENLYAKLEKQKKIRSMAKKKRG